MSFTSRRSSARAGQPARRDRNGLVGLSGWLFADLLLGVAVIFLVGSEVPQVGLRGTGENFKVTIDTVDDMVQKTSTIWKVQEKTFKLKINFDVEVRGFDVEDVVVSGDADQWVAALIDDVSKANGGREFIIELTPKSGLQDGGFTLEIPANAAFRKDGAGNIAGSQGFSVETCFKYTGIDAKREVRIPLTGAADKSVASLRNSLSLNDEIKKARDSNQKIGFMIIFGGGPQGADIARRNESNVKQALSELELVPSSKAASCDQSVPAGDLPTRSYKDEELGAQNLNLLIFYLSKTGN